MLSLSLNTCLESLSPLVWALSMTVSSPNLNHSWLQFKSCIGFLYMCMVLLLPWKPCCWHSTHIKLFKRSQSAIKCRCILRKNYSQRAYFDEVIPTCFRGPGFLFETVHYVLNGTHSFTHPLFSADSDYQAEPHITNVANLTTKKLTAVITSGPHFTIQHSLLYKTECWNT